MQSHVQSIKNHCPLRSALWLELTTPLTIRITMHFWIESIRIKNQIGLQSIKNYFRFILYALYFILHSILYSLYKLCRTSAWLIESNHSFCLFFSGERLCSPLTITIRNLIHDCETNWIDLLWIVIHDCVWIVDILDEIMWWLCASRRECMMHHLVEIQMRFWRPNDAQMYDGAECIFSPFRTHTIWRVWMLLAMLRVMVF